MPALPIFGIDKKALSLGLDKLGKLGVALDVAPTVNRLRHVLLQAARPMPNYGKHQVGAGFLSETVIDHFIEYSCSSIGVALLKGPVNSFELRELEVCAAV